MTRQFATLHGIEIFANGTHRGEEYAESDLRDMVRNYFRFRDLVKPPAVIGHEEDQSLMENTGIPAVGRIKNPRLRRDPEGWTLLADMTHVHHSIAKLIDARAYSKVSSEIYDEPPEGCEGGRGKMLRRVALLGGELPQIKSLADLPYAEFAEGDPDAPPRTRPSKEFPDFLEIYDDESGEWVIGDQLDPEDIDADPADAFDEADWKNEPGPRSKNRWVNVHDPERVVYATANPGKGGKGSKEEAEKRKGEREKKASALPSVSVAAGKEKLAATIAQGLGDGFKEEQIPTLIGAPHGSTVVAHSYKEGSVYLEMKHPAIKTCSRTMTVTPAGELIVKNEMFFLKPKFRAGGMGTKVFSEQVRTLATAGANKIQTVAGKGRGMNGWLTWPVLGYDAPLDAQQIAKLPEGLKDAKTVQDLYKTQEGKDFWKANGDMIPMEFDLTPGSPSMSKLNGYLAKKGMPTIEVDAAKVQSLRAERRSKSVAGQIDRTHEQHAAEAKAKGLDPAAVRAEAERLAPLMMGRNLGDVERMRTAYRSAMWKAEHPEKSFADMPGEPPASTHAEPFASRFLPALRSLSLSHRVTLPAGTHAVFFEVQPMARKRPTKFSDQFRATLKKFADEPAEVAAGDPPPEGVDREAMISMLQEWGVDPSVIDEGCSDELLAEFIRVHQMSMEQAASPPAEPPADAPADAPMGEMPTPLVPEEEDEKKKMNDAPTGPRHPAQVTFKYTEGGVEKTVDITTVVEKAVAAALKPIQQQSAATAAQVSKFHEAEKKKSIDSQLDVLVQQGKVLPAEIDAGLRDMLYQLDAVKKFSDGKTQLDKHLGLLGARPELVKLAERCKSATKGATGTAADEEVEKVKRFAETDPHLQDGLRAAGQTSADYVKAFSEAKKKKPTLTAAQYGVPEHYSA